MREPTSQEMIDGIAKGFKDYLRDKEFRVVGDLIPFDKGIAKAFSDFLDEKERYYTIHRGGILGKFLPLALREELDTFFHQNKDRILAMFSGGTKRPLDMSWPEAEKAEVTPQRLRANRDGSSMKAGDLATLIRYECIDSDEYLFARLEDGSEVGPSATSYWNEISEEEYQNGKKS